MQTSIQTQGRRVLISSRRHAGRIHAARQAARSARRSVAAAFRLMANGVADRAAWAQTLAFWRSSGQAWAAQLG